MPIYHTSTRLQLINSGYVILPNIDKRCLLPGWNVDGTAERTMKEVARWPVLYPRWEATGLLMRDGVASIDIDVNDAAGAAALLLEINRIAPEVGDKAPTRYSEGTCKAMVFCRVDLTNPDLFFKAKSRAFFRPGEENVRGADHKVELFGGGRNADGKFWQCGIYGPRSHNDAGEVDSRYVWDEGRPALHAVALAELPLITPKQLYAIADAFEAWATAAGWVGGEPRDTASEKRVYDITAESRFDTNKGGVGLTYDELANELVRYGDFGLRCKGSFIPGWKGSDRVDHCGVFHSPRHDCAAVFVHGDDAVHYPVEFAPVDHRAAFAEAMKDVFDDPPIPPDVPNWRERFVSSGRPKPSYHNAKLAVTAAGLICSENVFHNKLLLGRGRAPSSLDACIGELTEATLASLRDWLSNTYGFDPTAEHVRDGVVALCAANRFDPVVEMLAEAEANWDKVERLDRMAVEYLNAADTAFNKACVRKFMLGAVARARRPGIKFDTILTLESPEGWNKSSAFAVLAGDGNFADSKILGKDSKEVLENTNGVWIVEAADLAGMKKAEVEDVKTFASRIEDRARMAYGRLVTIRPRRFVVAGTTNGDRYLLSQTGNRRFWPVKVQKPIDLDVLRSVRLQLWGEAAHWQSKGESLVLPKELWKVASIEQEARRVVHPWEATLAQLGPVPDPNGPLAGLYHATSIVHCVNGEDRVPTWAIFEHALKLPAGQLNRSHSIALGEVMRLLEWEHKTFKLKGAAVKGYVRPSRGASDSLGRSETMGNV